MKNSTATQGGSSHTNNQGAGVNGSLSTLGFFDSGQGGLTIWSAVVRQFPQINTVYLGDNARYPYGTKSAATVKRYTLEAIITLMERGAEAVVVACGTASSVAVPSLTALFARPVLGIVDPMCSLATQAAAALGLGQQDHEPNANIALLATPYTVKSGRFAQTLERELPHGVVRVSGHACPLLVPLVEEGFQDHAIARATVAHYLAELPQSTRIIMLGCTHFPRLEKIITEVASEIFGRPVCSYAPGDVVPSDALLLIDPARAVPASLARQLHLLASGQATSQQSTGQHRIFCTDSPEGFERTARHFCDDSMPKVEQISIIL